MAVRSQLHISLNRLLRLARRLAVKVESLITPSGKGFGEDWQPSDGQLATAILAACCAFVSCSSEAKRLFVAAGTPPTTSKADSSDSSSGTSANQLLAAGLASSLLPAFRLLSLRLLSDLSNELSAAFCCSTLLPALSGVLQQQLHQLESASSRQCEEYQVNLTSWLHLLSCLMLSPRGLEAGGQTLYTSLLLQQDRIKDANEERSLVSILASCLSLAGGPSPTSNSLRLATLRVICGLCQIDRLSQRLTATTALGNSSIPLTLAALMISEGKGGGDKKCGSRNEDHPHGAVRAIAAVGLWCLIHQSERIKALLKQCPSPSLLQIDADKEDEFPFEEDSLEGDDNEEETGSLYMHPRIVQRAFRCIQLILSGS